jgi:hypothetical protein
MRSPYEHNKRHRHRPDHDRRATNDALNFACTYRQETLDQVRRSHGRNVEANVAGSNSSPARDTCPRQSMWEHRSCCAHSARSGEGWGARSHRRSSLKDGDLLAAL